METAMFLAKLRIDSNYVGRPGLTGCGYRQQFAGHKSWLGPYVPTEGRSVPTLSLSTIKSTIMDTNCG